MKIIVGTGNKHKLEEIGKILRGMEVEGRKIRVKEDGDTFAKNAIKKAKSIKIKDGEIAIADDSGLMVDCLEGKPGVRSARFATPPTPDNLCTKLLRKTAKYKRKTAKFVCVIAIKYPDGKIKTVEGVCRGKIATEMRGAKGFGYDPVFIPLGYKKTFAEMKSSTKNRISHRAKALRKLKNVI
jgi:non-canonical purine NTP pyrophosphatase (RdgB/HAM1 family)